MLIPCDPFEKAVFPSSSDSYPTEFFLNKLKMNFEITNEKK